MMFHRLFSSTLIQGLTLATLAVSANAATITYNTNAAGTKFTGGNFVLNSTSGAAASLTFIANGNSSSGTPSGINFGQFNLVCGNCTTQTLANGSAGTGSNFSAFTFSLVVTDVTDGGVGTFTGTSAGGAVFSDVSGISINWSPSTLGTGTTNATSGSFGPTSFTITNFTQIVAPNSGPPTPGETTVQGAINSATVPEPATFGMVGAALIGLGLLRRKQTRS